MSTLVESLSRIASRVEILARGVEGERRNAEIMLERRRPLDARDHARAILAKVPNSPLGLALWADAAEAAWLDHEAIEALSELASLVPWRADVWLRLGRVGLRTGWPHARDALERAASAPDEREAAHRALLDLSDLDLQGGDAARAQQWIDRLPTSLVTVDEAAVLRRAECALERGLVGRAKELAQSLSDQLGEKDAEGAYAEHDPGRRSLLLARVAWAEGAFDERRGEQSLERAAALTHAIRAFILEARGARDLFAAIVAATKDAVVVARLRDLALAMGLADDPSMTAAFALAEGRREDARAALVRALATGDPAAPGTLVRLAVESEDASALSAVQDRRPEALSPALRAILDAEAAVARREPGPALDAVLGVSDEAARPWADALARRAYHLWIDGERADWSSILGVLLEAARAVGGAADLSRIEALAGEIEKPILLAVVGEFNAGKSTFINALLGVDVAPTGILPTTASLHRVGWAPDAFARVIVRGAPDRVVSHEALKATLAALRAEHQSIERVHIYAPIERLRWVEILDTPGFNAPDPEHATVARTAFDDAHAVVWLLDATIPLKATEASILGEVAELGLPILVVLNKLDRLAAGDEGRVLEHTASGLASIGVRPHAPPMLLSAKDALSGRLGNEAALARSRWPEVEASIGAVVVDEADALRERAMRRKAASIALHLAAAARAEEEKAREAAAQRARRADALRAAAGRVSASDAACLEHVEAEIGEARRALGSDLRPLSELAETAREEQGVRAYVASRIVARLTLPILASVGRFASADPPAIAGALVAAALEGAAEALAAPHEIGRAVADGASSRATGTTEQRMLRAAVRAVSRGYLVGADELTSQAAPSLTLRRLEPLAAALALALPPKPQLAGVAARGARAPVSSDQLEEPEPDPHTGGGG